MANPHKGDVAISIGGVSLTLHYSVDALAELEEAAKRPINEIAGELQDQAKFSIATLRLLFWAALLDRHQKSFDEVRVILREANIAEVVAAVSQAFALAFPSDEGATESPQKPVDPPGIGPAS